MRRTDIAEVARRHPRDRLKLGAQMGSAGIVEPVGNLGDGEFVVDEQFLDALDLLQDAVALDGDAAVGGEEGAEGSVVGVQTVGEEVGEILPIRCGSDT